MEELIQLVVLFFVIFDPVMSFSVFFVATKHMGPEERRRTALMAIAVATLLSYSVLVLGEALLELFSVTLDDFKVAGGIILMILSVQMVLGRSMTPPDGSGNGSSAAIATLIATPLLTGPAAITAIIISVKDFGMASTFVAVTSVLVISGLMFLSAPRIRPYLNNTAVQVISTILGMITLSWGVKFIREGLGI